MTEQPRIPHSAWADEFNIVTGYMCLTDFECEFGASLYGNTVYPSIKALKTHRPSCAEECGIAEVKVYGVRIVQEPAEIER